MNVEFIVFPTFGNWSFRFLGASGDSTYSAEEVDEIVLGKKYEDYETD